MKKTFFLASLILLVLLHSCSLSPFENQETDSAMDGSIQNITEGTSLFTPDETNSLYTFETNDTKHISSSGRTFWTVSDINSGDSFEPVIIEVCKESGRSEAGFGAVFCSQEIDRKPFMLAVLINTTGLYIIGEITDGVFKAISGWKHSAHINKGYGIKNELAVSYDSENKKFTLKINSCTVTDFAVSKSILFKDSRSGYAAVIAHNENFPQIPVKVQFKKAGRQRI